MSEPQDVMGAMLEAERRGILPEDKQALLDEARKRGLVKDGVDFSFSKMVDNIPSSVNRMAGDMANAMMHPVDTYEGMKAITKGSLEKLGRKIANASPEWLRKNGVAVQNYLANSGMTNNDIYKFLDDWGVAPEFLTEKVELDDDGFVKKRPNESAAEAIGKFYGDRYGGSDNIKKTIMEDPFGAASDAAAVLTMGGSALSKAPGMIGKAGKIASKTGALVDPTNAAINTAKVGVAGGAKMLPRSLPIKMYEKSAKFPTGLSMADRTRITKTALKYGILPNDKGVTKARLLLDEFETNINKLIHEAAKTGKNIPKKALYKHLKSVRDELGGASNLKASKDLRQIDNVVRAYDTHLKSIGAKDISLKDAQKLKRRIYKDVNYAKAYGKAQAGTDKASKAIAKAAKESIEDRVPGVREINKEYGDLVDLITPLEKSANRLDNANLINADAALKIAAAAAVDPAATPVGVIAAMIDNAAFRARAAKGLYGLQTKKLAEFLSKSEGRAMAIQAIYQSGRAESVVND